jgi:F-type H+-transporting ATPase subunit a
MSSLESVNSLLPALPLPGLSEHQTLQVEFTWLAMLIVVAILVTVVVGLKRVPGVMQNLIELLTEFIAGFMKEIVGPRWVQYFPLVMTAFFLIIVSNYLGLLPGCIAPTGSLSTTAGFALIIFFYYNAVGVRLHGLKYFKHFIGPIPAMAPFMLPLEIISELARPFSLAIRLFANMMAGHVIIGLCYAALAIGVPLIGMLFESFVTAWIQAVVFSLLTMIYLGGAVLADEEH